MGIFGLSSQAISLYYMDLQISAGSRAIPNFNDTPQHGKSVILSKVLRKPFL
jgi:hypothetical protein